MRQLRAGEGAVEVTQQSHGLSRRVVAASEASWHHRTGMEGRKMQHLAPVRLFQALGWQPHVAMDCGIVDCNMEAIRGSVALQEGVDVTSWREHPAIQKNWI